MPKGRRSSWSRTRKITRVTGRASCACWTAAFSPANTPKPREHRAVLYNYLLVALHNLRRQPVFSAIKVLSLAIGLGCSLLVLMHVRYTLSYDKHIPDW